MGYHIQGERHDGADSIEVTVSCDGPTGGSPQLKVYLTNQISQQSAASAPQPLDALADGATQTYAFSLSTITTEEGPHDVHPYVDLGDGYQQMSGRPALVVGCYDGRFSG